MSKWGLRGSATCPGETVGPGLEFRQGVSRACIVNHYREIWATWETEEKMAEGKEKEKVLEKVKWKGEILGEDGNDQRGEDKWLIRWEFMYHSRSHQPSMEISVRKWKPLLYSLCLMVPMHRFLIDLFFFFIISVGSYTWSCLLIVLSIIECWGCTWT